MSISSSRWNRPMIAALAVLGSLHAIYFVQNVWADRDAERQKTSLLKRELAYGERKLISHDQFVEQLMVMSASLEKLELNLPKHLPESSIEDALQEQAALSQVEIANLHVDAEYLREGFYAEKPVALRVRGTTENFLAFMDRILRTPPLRSVREMQIEPGEGSGVQVN